MYLYCNVVIIIVLVCFLSKKKKEKQRESNKSMLRRRFSLPLSHVCLSRFLSSNPTTRIVWRLLIKTIPTIEEPDSGAPTTSHRRRFFSSSPTRRRRSLASSFPIQPQIGGALISNPTRWHFFSSILNRRHHPQSSGSLFTYD